MKDPLDVVERLAVGRIAGERRIDDGGKALARGHVDRDRDDLRLVNHDVVRFLLGELEGGVQHFLLDALDRPARAGFREEGTHVLTRLDDDTRRRRLDPEEPDDGVRRGLEQPDEWVGDPSQQVDRPR